MEPVPRLNESLIMIRSTSPGGTQAPGTSRPENENDDPVGDNKPIGESTNPDAPDHEPEAEEPPEGSDARPADRLNAHHPKEDFPRRPERQPTPDSKLPQSSRG